MFYNSNVPSWQIILGGIYGNGHVHSEPGTSPPAVDIVQNNANVDVFFNGSFVYGIANVLISPTSIFEGRNQVIPPSGGDPPGISGPDKYLAVDNLYFYTAVPEPSTVVLASTGILFALALAIKRRGLLVRLCSSRH